VKQLRCAAAFEGWLKRIMVTTRLEDVRRQKIVHAAELDAEAMGSYRDTTAKWLDLDAALALLPPETRLCVVLAYNEGLSHPQIAAMRHGRRGARRARGLGDPLGRRLVKWRRSAD
jgi:DNA-directed RNA polymerase specialized sigma24 family protein